jgi:Bifunctional DNA primase/polymerase, N-terminal
MSPLDAALAYAVRGFAVFPLRPRQKEPATNRGFYDATTNPELIRRWWRAKDYNIAIRAGAASGIWLLDVDTRDERDGESSIRKLEAEHGPLPQTLEAISGSGGRHLWFKYSGPIPNSKDKIASGLEIKCDTGYGVAPPSIHPCGRAYAWSVDCADAPAEAPGWLVAFARKPKATISQRAVANIRGRPRSGSPDAYGQAALDDECATLAATAKGGRNNQLNRSAFSLFQLVAGGELHESEVVDRLIDACHLNGLIADDGLRSVELTIRSGTGAGLQYPRSRSGAL